jgi:hypothetical protein
VSSATWIALCAASLGAACAGSGTLARDSRAAVVEEQPVAWRAASAEDVPGVYVSSELSGPLAGYLRKLVYLFEADGSYAGAALVDASPPRFEVLAGTWAFLDGRLVLDGGPPAVLEVADGGALRLSGDEGVVVLERERAR